MKTKTTKRSIWMRSLVILPLLAILIYGFSEKVNIEKEVQSKNVSVSNNKSETNNFDQNRVVNMPDIHIKINSKNQILINNDKLVTLKSIGAEIKKLVANYNPEQIENTIAIVEAPDNIDMGFVIDVIEEVRKAGIISRKYITKMNVAQVKYFQEIKEKVTKEQIAEYNNIAKKYNNMPTNNMIVNKIEVKRLMYIYGIMSVKQRKNAEPYPVFPPLPPTPKSSMMERTKVIPPPPPLPENASPEQKEKYKNAMKRYKAQAPVNSFEYKSNKGELVEIVEVPLSPSLPDTPMELIMEMANKDARFYYNGQIISSKEAIKIMKSKNNINLAVISGKSKKPIVNLYDKSFKTSNLITE